MAGSRAEGAAPLPLDRRGFLRALVAAGGAALVPAQEVLRVGLVLPAARSPAAASIARGVELGAAEAARTGGLLGRGIEVRPLEPDAAAARALREAGIAALVGGDGEERCRALAAAAEAASVPFLNVGCTSDALRGAECRRSTYHVEASASMYRDALAGGAAPEARRAVLWHPALERSGAAQLNDRFRARFSREMDGPAWAGWVAVKILFEASLRARSTAPAALAAYLARERTEFDGHKGWPLSFRAWDHQLRQPLYLVAGARLLGEVPLRSAAGASREMLDRLGATAATSACRLRTNTP